MAADSLYEGPREGVRRQVFVPSWGKIGATFYVRTQNASASAFTQIRGELRTLDAGIPVYAMKTVEGQLDETLLTDRLIAMLSAGFGLLATVLASVGLYGVMAFVVARRRKEMGLRLALGADPSHVVWLVMKEVLLLLGIGLAVGVPAAVGLGRLVGIAALRHSAERSVDGTGHDRLAGVRVGGGRIHSRAPRQPHRSESGAALRVGPWAD